MKGQHDGDRGQCLTDETLTDYLEGALDPGFTAICEVHMVSCDRCREALALYMRLMNSAVTADERIAIDSAAAAWDRRKSVLRPVAAGSRSRFKRLYWSIVGIASAAVLGVFILWNAMPVEPPQSAGGVVQLLLAQDRPFELRLNEQPYLPIVRTRGNAGANVDYGLIADEMTRLAADSYAMGRFYLLQRDFDRAAAELEKALEEALEKAEKQTAGAPAAVHNDLGVVYMERGGDVSRLKAAEEFRQALQLDPAFAPAVFNLAIYHERTGALREAETQWRRYLEVDSTSGWAEEVRSRLETVKR